MGGDPKFSGMKITRMDEKQAVRARPWRQQAKRDVDMDCQSAWEPDRQSPVIKIIDPADSDITQPLPYLTLTLAGASSRSFS